MKNSISNKSVWRKLRIIVLLPVVSFIWMIGWTLYWVGDHRVRQNAQKENMHVFQTCVSERKDFNEVKQFLA
jgi:Tfp pilus assembly protein PilO